MNANKITKIFLSVLGRNPLAETWPALRLYLPFETAPLKFPAVIATCSLSAREPRGNASADVEATFTLALDAEDFTSDQAEAMAAELAEALTRKLDADALNLHAEDLGLAAHFYFFRWNVTDAPAVNSEGKLSFSFSFIGSGQF